jgi:hypothetical protein
MAANTFTLNKENQSSMSNGLIQMMAQSKSSLAESGSTPQKMVF